MKSEGIAAESVEAEALARLLYAKISCDRARAPIFDEARGEHWLAGTAAK